MSAHPLSADHLRHLAHRMASSVRAQPLTPREESEVAALLQSVSLARLFWDQPVIDQRHALESARAVLADRPGDRTLAAAALLHDIGKRHARLGIAGRVFATVLAMGHLPAPGRLGVYLDHARLGALDLEAAAAPSLIVAYARYQDDSRPDVITPQAWRALKRADGESHRLPSPSQYDDADAEDE